MNTFDTNEILLKIKEYTFKLGYSEEISNRFFEMYKKEMEHLIDMNKKFSTLNHFKRFTFGKTISKDDFILKDNDDLFFKSINNVNNISRQIFNCY